MPDAPKRLRRAGGSGFSRTSQAPLVKAWGTNGTPVWSPDGSKFAFVSNRVDHSLIGVYDVRTRTVTFLSPSVDHDTSPTWSPDGKRVAFIRRPGTPFGQQAHQGAGSIGNPDGPAYNPLTALRGGGAGGRTAVDAAAVDGGAGERRPIVPGLYDCGVHRRLHAGVLRRPTSRPARARSSGTTRKTTRTSTRSPRSVGRRGSRDLRSRAAGVGAWYSVQRVRTAQPAPRDR